MSNRKIVTFFENMLSPYHKNENMVEVSNVEFYEMLSRHIYSLNKKDMPCFSPVTYRSDFLKLSEPQGNSTKKNFKFETYELAFSKNEINEFLKRIEVNYKDENFVVDDITKELGDKLNIDITDRVMSINDVKIKTFNDFIEYIESSTEDIFKVTLAKNTGTYRNDFNVESINYIVLDLDLPNSLEEANKIFSDYERCIYSTYSYDSKNPKFRMVISLKEEIKAEDWSFYFKCLVSGIDADRACGNNSRIYFLPTHNPKSDLKPYFKYHSGKEITLDNIISIGKKNGIEIDDLYNTKGNSGYYSPRLNPLSQDRFLSRYYHRKSPSYKLEDLMERHYEALEELRVTDSRNVFCFKVIFDEIKKYGEKCDIPYLVNFLYYVSNLKEYSSRGLDSIKSDTASHLYRMINGAINKIEGHELSKKYSDLEDVVDKSIIESKKYSRNLAYFEKKFKDSDSILYGIKGPNKNAVSYDFDEMKKRHSELILDLKNNKISDRDFVKKYIVNEIKMNSHSFINIFQTIQFAYRFLKEEKGITIKGERFIDSMCMFIEKTIKNESELTFNKLKNISSVAKLMCNKIEKNADSNMWVELKNNDGLEVR